MRAPPPVTTVEPSAAEAAVVAILAALARQVPSDIDVLDLSWPTVGLDSLDLLEFAVRCEDELAITIPDAVLARWATPRQAVDYLERNLPCGPGHMPTVDAVS
ncbi:MAG: hypothetical protein QOE80_2038 [Actinomycetota bacterium]|nr:hypothetical protein [Actinomycetota bacterium]